MSEYAFGDVVRAWGDDPAWRARVEEDPKEAFAEKGVDMSGIDEVRVAVNTPDIVHVVFPAGDEPLSDAALERAVGGTAGSSWNDGAVVWDENGNYIGNVPPT